MASAAALTRSNSSASRVGSEAMIVSTSIFLLCVHTITTICDRALAPPGHFEKWGDPLLTRQRDALSAPRSPLRPGVGEKYAEDLGGHPGAF